MATSDAYEVNQITAANGILQDASHLELTNHNLMLLV
jgi:hypothetical protein